MNRLVVDSSCFISFIYNDEYSAYADHALRQIYAQDGTALVPRIFWLETANTLLLTKRRGRISSEWYQKYCDSLHRFIAQTVQTHPLNELLILAEQHHLSLYDSCFLSVAMKWRVPLATLDKALIAAAQKNDLYYTAS